MDASGAASGACGSRACSAVNGASSTKATQVGFSADRSVNDEKSVGKSGLALSAKEVPYGNMYGIMLHKEHIAGFGR